MVDRSLAHLGDLAELPHSEAGMLNDDERHATAGRLGKRTWRSGLQLIEKWPRKKDAPPTHADRFHQAGPAQMLNVECDARPVHVAAARHLAHGESRLPLNCFEYALTRKFEASESAARLLHAARHACVKP